MSRKSNISVYVSSNVERALKQLKKKIEREGVVRDMKRTTPSRSIFFFNCFKARSTLELT